MLGLVLPYPDVLQPLWPALRSLAQRFLMDLDTVPCGVRDVNVLLMSKGRKHSPSSQLVFQPPAFTFPGLFLGEPELLLVVVLFCKRRSTLAH